MAISLLEPATVSQSLTLGSTHTHTLTSTPIIAGDFIFVVMSVNDGCATGGVSSTPAGYTAVCAAIAETTQTPQQLSQAFYKVAVGGEESDVLSWTFGGSGRATFASMIFTGVDTGTPFDYADHAAHFATVNATSFFTAQPGSIASDALLIDWGTTNSTTVTTVSSDYTGATKLVEETSAVSTTPKLFVFDGPGANYNPIFLTTITGSPTDASADWTTQRLAFAAGTPSSTTETQTIVDSDRQVVIKFVASLGRDETNALKVDVSTLAPESRTGRPVAEVAIEQIKASTYGLAVDVLWDATSPQQCLTLSGSMDINYDFRAVGPLTNNAGAGKTGDILFSTNGASLGSSYYVELVLVKKY